jgi:hypothetical protein
MHDSILFADILCKRLLLQSMQSFKRSAFVLNFTSPESFYEK